jgi:putative oxidoreductase
MRFDTQIFLTLNRFALIAGRLAIAALFLHESWFKITHLAATTAYMQRFGVWPVLLPGVLLVELGGGLALATGIGVRFGALALAGFSVVAAFLFHWNWTDQNQLLHFEKDIAIAGGLLVLACNDFRDRLRA